MYCSLSIYGATPKYLKHQIENRVERIVRPLQKCEQVLVKRICSFVHRCIYNNNICNVFENYFENTRNNGKKLIIPDLRASQMQNNTGIQGKKSVKIQEITGRIG